MWLKLKEVLSMNKHGQSLVTFVLILPLLVLFIAFFIDSALSVMEKSKLEGIIYDNMKISLEKEIRDVDLIGDSIKKNSDVNIVITINEDELKINAKSNKKNIFGKLLKLPYYNLEVTYCGNYVDKKIDKNCR